MKEIIKKLLKHQLFERVMINDTNELALVYIKNNNIFLLFNTVIKEPLGYIGFDLTDGDVYGIYGAYAQHGYGPLLYELVMTLVYPKGITMSDDSATSSDALNIWEKFMERGDVIKKPIKRNRTTEKEEILKSDIPFGDDKYMSWVDRVIKLHYTQFIGDFGKNKLNELIIKGNQFVRENPTINLMGAVYWLEGGGGRNN